MARHFGAMTPATNAELQAQISRLASVVRSGPGAPKPGRQIFQDQCARCHTLFGKGGKVGPDLTTYRRDDLETMLLNIVNPSAEIREGYASHVVATTDGRTLSGIVIEQDQNVVVLRSERWQGHAAARVTRSRRSSPPVPRSCLRVCSKPWLSSRSATCSPTSEALSRTSTDSIAAIR